MTHLRLLLVDDFALVRSALRRHLGTLALFSRLELTVTDFGDPREALASFQPSAFDGALLDVDLNIYVMSGVELAQALRQADPDLPIAFVTATPEALGPSELATLGDCLVLTKPWSVEGLAEFLKRLAPRE